MTRQYIACDKFDPDFVFKVTRIIGSFDTEILKVTQTVIFGFWKIFIMTEDTSLE